MPDPLAVLPTPEDIERIGAAMMALEPVNPDVAVIVEPGPFRPIFAPGPKVLDLYARAIYFYGGEHIPVYALLAYAKSTKTDLSPSERRAVRKIKSCQRRNSVRSTLLQEAQPFCDCHTGTTPCAGVVLSRPEP